MEYLIMNGICSGDANANIPVHVLPLYPAVHAQSAVPAPETLHAPPFWQGAASQTLAKK